MRLVLFGPPGAGKGTQARLLGERRGLAHISTGSIIRAAMKAGTGAGEEARAYVEAGPLVPGRLVQALAEDAIAEAGYDDFVLDGYPRTIEQAEWLTVFLTEYDAPLDVVVSLAVPEEQIVERLSQRRIHRETGENYHLGMRPPPEGLDPALIVQRPDDRPEAVRKRLAVYREKTAPVEAYYRERGRLVEASGVGTLDEVYARIEQALNEAAPAQVR